MEDHVLIHVDPHLTPGLKEILRRKRDDKLLNLIINKGQLCICSQGSNFYLKSSEMYFKVELWKTIDWNALVKMSDVFQVFSAQRNFHATLFIEALTESKLNLRQINKEAESEILPIINLHTSTAFRTTSCFTEEIVISAGI